MLAEVRDRTIDSLTLVNDLYSFHKERHILEAVNAVWIIMRENALTLQEAVDKLVEVVLENERQLIAARDRVLAGSLGERADVRAYLTELAHMHTGSAEFHTVSPRYYSDDIPGRFRSGPVTIKPIPTIEEIAAADRMERRSAAD